MNKYSFTYILFFILALFHVSCVDDLKYDSYVIGNGEGKIKATVEFHALEPALQASRSAGNAVDQVNKLWVVIYQLDDEGNTNFYKKFLANSLSDYKIDQKGNVGSPSDAPTGDNIIASEERTPKADFTINDIPFGRYKIYAVGNVEELTDAQCESIETLCSQSFTWNSDVAKDNQMFGYFTAATNPKSEGFDAPVVIVNSKSVDLHAWIKRLVSKVTVSYDGSSLKDGVSIYIKSLSIKKIPKSCCLGVVNTPDAAGQLIDDGESITYFPDEALNENYSALITNSNPFFPRKDVKGKEETDSTAAVPDSYSPGNDPHRHTSPMSLFFFENMQGTGPDKSQKDENGDGILDEKFPFEDKQYATYIEVAAYYESINPERPGISDIVYRFMLGKNITTDYNAERNFHYKLTLHFNGFANEPDWRIDYVNFLGVTQPDTVDYRGKFLEPNYNLVNFGHTYGDDNIITVNSYQYNKADWGNNISVPFTIEYADGNGNESFSSTKPEWFTLEQIQPTEAENKAGTTKYRIKYKNDYSYYSLSEQLSKNTQKSSDLAAGTSGITTANCYIVDAAGTYQFPLVYGNAILNGNPNTSAYCGFGSEDRSLDSLVNYLNKPIKEPYIIDDIKTYGIPTDGLTPFLVWEDVEGLIDITPATFKYAPSLYGGKGGIQFKIGTLAQGNAVIAIKNKAGEIMWSWHIWVTSIKYKDDADGALTLKAHSGKLYNIMPVDLGWRSYGDNDEVRHYPRHECKVRFTQKLANGQEGYSQTITIVQEPHIAVPQGTHTYYQWGRKDPFVGSYASYDKVNSWWYQSGNEIVAAPWPYRLSLYEANINNPGYVDPKERDVTKNILGLLIQKPNTFNNTRFEDFDKKILGDTTYSNLWSNDTKTVYDPCPVGYMVSPKETFTGFTFNGDNVAYNSKWLDYKPPVDTGYVGWFNVATDNMLAGYGLSQWLLGFYNNHFKLVSLDYPLCGYLDYDAVLVYFFSNHGYIWTAENTDDNNSLFFKYCLDSTWEGTDEEINKYGLVGPVTGFYHTDGCAVRPTKSP